MSIGARTSGKRTLVLIASIQGGIRFLGAFHTSLNEWSIVSARLSPSQDVLRFNFPFCCTSPAGRGEGATQHSQRSGACSLIWLNMGEHYHQSHLLLQSRCWYLEGAMVGWQRVWPWRVSDHRLGKQVNILKMVGALWIELNTLFFFFVFCLFVSIGGNYKCLVKHWLSVEHSC